MSKKKLTYEGEVEDNLVHENGVVHTKVKSQEDSFIRRLLGKVVFTPFPAEPEDMGDWKEGDEVKITVENLDR